VDHGRRSRVVITAVAIVRCAYVSSPCKPAGRPPLAIRCPCLLGMNWRYSPPQLSRRTLTRSRTPKVKSWSQSVAAEGDSLATRRLKTLRHEFVRAAAVRRRFQGAGGSLLPRHMRARSALTRSAGVDALLAQRSDPWLSAVTPIGHRSFALAVRRPRLALPGRARSPPPDLRRNGGSRDTIRRLLALALCRVVCLLDACGPSTQRVSRAAPPLAPHGLLVICPAHPVGEA